MTDARTAATAVDGGRDAGVDAVRGVAVAGVVAGHWPVTGPLWFLVPYLARSAATPLLARLVPGTAALLHPAAYGLLGRPDGPLWVVARVGWVAVFAAVQAGLLAVLRRTRRRAATPG